MNLIKGHKVVLHVDHSAIYFENEKLLEKMHQQIDFLSKDKHRAFLCRQSEIANVLGNLDKLEAFREAVNNRVALGLPYGRTNNSLLANRCGENLTPRETKDKKPEQANVSIIPKANRASGKINQFLKKHVSFTKISEDISCFLEKEMFCNNFKSLNQNSLTKGMKAQTDYTSKQKLHEHTQQDSVEERCEKLSNFEAPDKQKPIKTFKISTGFHREAQEKDQDLYKRPFSCKEQWAGLGDSNNHKRKPTLATSCSIFRGEKSRRICSARCMKGRVEAKTLRRLKEIYIVKEADPTSTCRNAYRTHFIQLLLVRNQQQKLTLQERIRNFLGDLGSKRRKISHCAKLSTLANNDMSINKEV